MENPSLLELSRFFDKINIQENGCWIWIGAKQKAITKLGKVHKVSAGYGIANWKGKNYRAHRLLWIWINGEIPEKMTLDHQCHTNDETCQGGNTCIHRSCVNPNHLKLMSRKENVLSGNTLTAKNKNKIYCKNGHEFTSDNLKKSNRGKRICKICQNLYQQKRRSIEHGRSR